MLFVRRIFNWFSFTPTAERFACAKIWSNVSLRSLFHFDNSGERDVTKADLAVLGFQVGEQLAGGLRADDFVQAKVESFRSLSRGERGWLQDASRCARCKLLFFFFAESRKVDEKVF